MYFCCESEDVYTVFMVFIIDFLAAKLTVVGESGCGKTSTVSTLLGEEFRASDDGSTLGLSLVEAKAELEKPEEPWVRVSEEAKGKHVLKAAAKLMVEKDGELETKVRDLLFGFSGGQGTGAGGLEEGAVKPFQLRALSAYERQNSRALVNQAKEDAHMVTFGIWDYGGQQVFHPMHDMLLTESGVFLVVFSLSSFKEQQATCEAYLRSWLNSIRLHAKLASVILVGTHLDELERPEQELPEINAKLKDFLQQKSSMKTIASSSEYCFFPVSNLDSRGIVALRREIAKATSKQEQVYQDVSIRWLRFLDLVVIQQPGRVWLSEEDAETTANTAEVYSSEIREMLQFFKELGQVLYFENSTAFRKMIITEPSWLIEEITKVINISFVRNFETKALAEDGLEEAWAKMCETGVASQRLLGYIWGAGNIKFFLHLMTKLMLLCKWEFGDGEGDYYLIPRLLHDRPSNLKSQSEEEELRCKFVFTDSFFPKGSFERLICLCVEYAATEQMKIPPVLFADSARITLSSGMPLSLLLEQDSVVLTVSTDSADILDKYSAIVGSMLRKLNDDAMHGGLSWELYYESEKGIFDLQRKLRKASTLNESNEGSVMKPEGKETKSANLNFDDFLDDT